jgi:hypothetical protein
MSETWSYAKASAWTHRRKAILGWFVGVAVFGAAAFAAWVVTSNTGIQGGKVNGGVLTGPTFLEVDTAEVVDTIFPGQTKALTFKINNTGTAPLKLTSLTMPLVGNAGVTAGAPSGACSGTPDNIVFNPYSNTTGVPIPVGTSIVTVPDTVTMPLTAAQGCQGDTFEFVNLEATFEAA